MKKQFAIFHIDDERTIKGGERQLLYLAFELRTQGHWNCIVCRAGSQLDTAARKAGFDRLHLPFLFEWDPVSAMLLRTQAASAAAGSGLPWRPERVILHAHTAHAAALAAMAAAGTSFRRVAHRREDFPLSNSLSIKAKYTSAAALIAVSGSVAELMRESGVPPGKISVVPDSVPRDGFPWDAEGLDAYRRKARAALFSSLDIPEDCLCAGSITALETHKDPITFMRAIPQVLGEVPWTHFVISGEGPLLAEMKNLSMDLKIRHRLHLLPASPEPMELLAALDVFVLSSWNEGMGSSLLEAMAAGTPIAATNTAGVQEVVEDGRSGFLVNPRSPQELAKALSKLLKNPGLCALLRSGGFERRKHFDSEVMAARVADIYARD
jgi:glycosyltransferase involved in cell wall biosynthesis